MNQSPFLRPALKTWWSLIWRYGVIFMVLETLRHLVMQVLPPAEGRAALMQQLFMTSWLIVQAVAPQIAAVYLLLRSGIIRVPEGITGQSDNKGG